MISKTPDLMKFKRLQRRLGESKRGTVGLLELMWIEVAKNCPLGDIGQFTNEEIAIMVEWDGDPDELVASLIECRWLDNDTEHRLVVHDWLEHCPNYVKGNLVKYGKISPKAASSGETPTEHTQGTSHAEDPPSQAKPSQVKPSQATSSADAQEAPGNRSDSDEFVTIWNSFDGVRRCTTMSAPRQKRLRARLKDRIRGRPWLDVLREDAPAHFPLKCFGSGEWRPDVDWILKPDNLTKIIEGKYDWQRSNSGRAAAATGPGQVFDEPSRHIEGGF